MFSITITPRFGDVDGLGHINNIVPAMWFETARTSLIRIFDPELAISKKTFPLIVARTEYDFTGQLYIRSEVQIKSWISRIGTKSFTVYQEAWQEGRLGVKGSTVLVHFDFNTMQSTPIPEDKKKILAEHLLEKLETFNTD